ncbi:BC85_0335 family putative methyltransferase [Mycoplasma sp. 480]|uniref:BC85_0335 family putative methyltransferase n=1 Tax=Mycoplasma sp. 480 TaxID=3440155 RepID=UPI003F517B85
MEIWKIILITSMFVVLFIGFLIYFILKIYTNKEIQKYKEENKKFEVENKHFLKEEIQEEIKDATEWMVEEFEFFMNTIDANNYKNLLFVEEKGFLFYVVNKQLQNLNSFLSSSKINDLQKRFNMNINNFNIDSLDSCSLDFVFIDTANINDKIEWDKMLSLLKENRMLVLKTNKKSFTKEIKEFVKNKNLKHNYIKISNTFLLIVI